MGENTFLFVGLIAFFVPIAGYCLVLAMVNRRFNPVMISGSWDTIGLLFACSGVLLVCGPGIITTHFQRLSTYQGIEKDDEGNPVKKEPPPLEQKRGKNQEAEAIPWNLWWVMAWAGYYLFVLAMAALLVRSRRDKTVIYNVDADVFEPVLERVLEKCSLASVRMGRTVFIGPREVDVIQEVEPSAAANPVPTEKS